MIAGVRGGSGKTTVSLGLVTAWRKQGLAVTPFKKGPDYIDAGWLSFAAARPCYNLDPFLVSPDRIPASFRAHVADADCVVIEGNRGLYDGMDVDGSFSTAEVSLLLDVPVVLVLDCTKMTRTAGALLLGLQKFDRRLRIHGVILNQIAGPRHEKIIRDVIRRYCGIPVVGAIPRLPGGFLSERHMGLTSSHEYPDVEKAVSYAGEIARKYMDIGKLFRIASSAPPLPAHAMKDRRSVSRGGATVKPRIGILRDAAFQFYYPDNIEALVQHGAEIVEVTALKGRTLPDIDALYIGGGFPETHAIALAENVPFRTALKGAVERGLPVYAECGGLMYLGKSLVLGKKSYPMANIFPLRFSLEARPQAHGYTIVKVRQKNPYYPKGTVLRGHEFHYSKVMEGSMRNDISYVFAMERGQGIIQRMDGICYRNVLATYTHIHALGTPEWGAGMIRQAIAYRAGRLGS